MRDLREAVQRDPSVDSTPLDKASFYIEELKYGPGPGKVEVAHEEEILRQLRTLLKDAHLTSMSAEELLEASAFYGFSLAQNFGAGAGEGFTLMWSVFIDGLMHGIGLDAGLEGEPRDARYERQR